MKKYIFLIISLVVVSFVSVPIFADEDTDTYQEPDKSASTIVPLSDPNNIQQVFIQKDDIETTITPRDATGYTYKNFTTLSSKTYTNKLLKTLKTSSVWSTASNSIKPTISLTVSKTNSISLSLSNGTENFTLSQDVSLTSSEFYEASPKAKGYRVSIGLYAKKVVAKKTRMSAYSNATGKFSHYVYSNNIYITGVYVGKADSK